MTKERVTRMKFDPLSPPPEFFTALPGGVDHGQVRDALRTAFAGPVTYYTGPVKKDADLIGYHRAGRAPTSAEPIWLARRRDVNPRHKELDPNTKKVITLDRVHDIGGRLPSSLSPAAHEAIHDPTTDYSDRWAVKPEWDQRNGAYVPRNQETTFRAPAGARVSYIEGKTKEQWSNTDQRIFPGRGRQVLLLDYDRSKCALSQHPRGVYGPDPQNPNGKWIHLPQYDPPPHSPMQGAGPAASSAPRPGPAAPASSPAPPPAPAPVPKPAATLARAPSRVRGPR